jgi:hypothetical protein
VFQDQLAVMLKGMKARFQSMKHRFRQAGSMAFTAQFFDSLTLVGNVGLSLGNVLFGLGEMLVLSIWVQYGHEA